METQQYHGITLFLQDAALLEDVERLLQKEIPCLEDRLASRQAAMATMGDQSGQIAQIEASLAQMEAQSPLKVQFQQIQMMEAQYDRQTGLTEEQLIEMYVAQFLASVTPQYKAQIQSQLAMLIPMMGEQHPTILQLKEIISMDEAKARAKSEKIAKFYVPFLQLREMTQQEAYVMYDKMYDASAPESELETAMRAYYEKVTTPEYQSLLSNVIKLGPDTVGIQDPNFQ